MKLGEGGEAFFVFETLSNVPESLQTSPLVSPSQSPQQQPTEAIDVTKLPEPDLFDLQTDSDGDGKDPMEGRIPVLERHGKSDLGINSKSITNHS
jgi:phosphatidate phosphatase LPIN